MANVPTDRRAGFATGLALLVPITLSTMAIVLLAPILPLLIREFGNEPGAAYLVPMILTLPALCVAVLSPVAGILGDYFGRRRLLLASLAIYGLFGLLPTFLSDLKLILLSRLGVGITEAMIMTLSTTMIGDYFTGERRDRWLAAQTACASLSALLFFNVGGLLGTIDWRAPFWVYATALLMFVAVYHFTWRNDERGAATAGEASSGNIGWAAFPWARMTGIVLVTIFASILFYTVLIQAAPGLSALGLTSPAEIGFLTSLASIGVPLGTLIYSRISRMPVRRLLTIEFGILSVGFLLMSSANSMPAFLAGCAINQIGAGMILPTLLVWAMSQLAYEVRARGTGIWQAAFALGQWLSPIAVTTIGLQVGGLLPSFAWLGYAACAAAVVALVVGTRFARTHPPLARV